jgi:POT family proton-dependent oligopeptide transporter
MSTVPASPGDGQSSVPVVTTGMPKGIPFIVANEFAERFCYYGITAILAVYFVQSLHFGEAQATAWVSYFKSAAYFFPLLGAVLADVWWGKFRVILVFSAVYCAGCTVLALATEPTLIAVGLFMIAFGTGGIKPCVSTNLGDQFTSANSHLIERAYNWFYLSINAGSTFSILMCPVLLQHYGPGPAFGVPAALMFVALVVFWSGRQRFAVVPPAGRVWLETALSREGLRTFLRLALIYLFIAVFWTLWDQSAGTTWQLQARSDLMDKELFAGIRLLPAQVSAINAVLILILAPTFSYVVYPLVSRFTTVTSLRKIGTGLFLTALSFLIIAGIEARIQAGQVVSVWWQVLAYAVLSSGEVLVSITGLEYSYRQAPLSMKSFVMALFLFSVSLGNLLTAQVNQWMVRPLTLQSVESGAQTRVRLAEAQDIVEGQKIDLQGTGLVLAGGAAAPVPLEGTYLAGAHSEGAITLLDPVTRQVVQTRADSLQAQAHASTYKLVGPGYFRFFAGLMAAVAVIFVFVATRVQERTHLRGD